MEHTGYAKSVPSVVRVARLPVGVGVGVEEEGARGEGKRERERGQEGGRWGEGREGVGISRVVCVGFRIWAAGGGRRTLDQ